RSKEVLGLTLDDLSFDREVVLIRPHEHHEGGRLKTEGSTRPIRMWPQLKEILQPYVDRRIIERGGTLLFPAPGDGGMISDWRKTLDAIGRHAGFPDGSIRSKMFRHTYCAARLQTLDNGRPVSTWTVSGELGHGSTRLVQEAYGHLGTIRHR